MRAFHPGNRRMLRQGIVCNQGDVITARIARRSVLVLYANSLLGEYDATSGLEQPSRVALAASTGKRMDIQHAAISLDLFHIAVGAEDWLRVFDTKNGREVAAAQIGKCAKSRHVAWGGMDSVIAVGCADSSCR